MVLWNYDFPIGARYNGVPKSMFFLYIAYISQKYDKIMLPKIVKISKCVQNGFRTYLLGLLRYESIWKTYDKLKFDRIYA